ncbi:hypothetical protein Tco_0038897 [Tanacetum coccineum]
MQADKTMKLGLLMIVPFNWRKERSKITKKESETGGWFCVHPFVRKLDSLHTAGGSLDSSRFYRVEVECISGITTADHYQRWTAVDTPSADKKQCITGYSNS